MLDFSSILAKRLIDRPDEPAYTFLIDEQNHVSCTNKELYERAQSIACFLASHARNEPIILMFNPGLSFIYSLYGCLMSGNIAVPVVIPKPQQEENLARVIKNCEAKYILSESNLIARYETILEGPLWVDASTLAFTGKGGQFYQPQSEDIAIIQYTSGSTGFPKGAMVSYGNLSHNLHAIKDHFNIQKDSVSFSWLPHYHDMGLMDGILQPMISGCKCILTSPRQVVGRPDFWLDCLTKFKVTHTGGPNFFFDLCCKKTSDKKDWDLRSLEDVYVSAEPVRIKTLKRFAEKFARFGFSIEKFTPGFGLAEATLMVSCKTPATPIITESFQLQSHFIDVVSLGKPIKDVIVSIVDPDTNEKRMDGELGEVWIKGPSVTQGYWNDKAHTHEIYYECPDGSKYLRTGDLGTMKSGELFILGRLKDTIIVNGVNYYAEDIEYTISQSHQQMGNESCLVFSVEDGEKEEIVILMRVPAQITYEALKDLNLALRKELFEKFGISKVTINFHTGPSYSKTTSGKVRRSYNRELFIQNKFNLLIIN